MNNKLILSNHVNTERAERPAAKILSFPMQGAWIQSLVRELVSTCYNLRVRMLQLKIQHAATDPL